MARGYTQAPACLGLERARNQDVIPPRLRATGSADQRTFEAVRAGTDDTFHAMR